MKNITKLVCMGLLASGLVGCSTINEYMDEFILKKEAESQKEEERGESVSKDVKKEDTAKKEEASKVETDTTKEEKVEEVNADTTVYETDVMNLLNNQAVYNGKMVRVKGIVPEGKIFDANNTEMFGLMADDGANFIQITGTEPTVSSCYAWVSGKAVIVNGEITIEATGYEMIEQVVQQPVEEQVVDQQAVAQQQSPANQQYYYRIVNGERVFETAEGQAIWDARQKQQQNESQNNNNNATDTVEK